MIDSSYSIEVIEKIKSDLNRHNPPIHIPLLRGGSFLVKPAQGGRNNIEPAAAEP
jgi:hypothetical protein